jgi:hypothetical protein
VNEWTRTFVHIGRAWYGRTRLPSDREVDVVYFGLSSEGGGTCGEFSMKWIDLGNHGPTPLFGAFDDSWRALPHIQDVLNALAKRRSATPAEFCALLVECGFKDETEEVRPSEAADPHADVIRAFIDARSAGEADEIVANFLRRTGAANVAAAWNERRRAS